MRLQRSWASTFHPLKGVILLTLLALFIGFTIQGLDIPIKLILGIFFVVFIPGALVRCALHRCQRPSFIDNTLFYFLYGYCVIFLINVVVFTFGLTLNSAVIALSILNVIAAAWLIRVAIDRRPATITRQVVASTGQWWSSKQSITDLGGAALLTALSFAAWTIEAPIRGEELFEIIQIRKTLNNEALSISNILHRPNAITTYIFTPYYFFVALVTEITGQNLFVVYVKLRSLYVLLSVLTFYRLTYYLTQDSTVAGLAFLCLCTLILVDPDPWSWPGSQFPFVRRGSVAAGVLLPIGILYCISLVGTGKRDFRSGVVVVAIFTLSLATTHALAAATFMFWLAGWTCDHWFRRDRRSAWRPTTVLLVSLAGLGLYRIAHSQLVTQVAEFEGPVDLTALWQDLAGPITNYFGEASSGYRHLVASTGTHNPFGFLPLLALPLAVVLSYRHGKALWWAVAPSILVISSIIGYTLLIYVTTREIQSITGYYILFGLIAFVLIAYKGFGEVLSWSEATRGTAKILFWVALCAFVIVCAIYTPTLILWVYTHPLIIIAGPLIALLLLTAGFGRNRQILETVRVAHHKIIAGGLTLLMALMLTISSRNAVHEIWHWEAERKPLWSQVWASREKPSVVDWDQYYRLLQSTIQAPKLTLSWPDMEKLGQIIPSGAVVVFDPEGSFALPVFLDLYIVNPGHVIATDLDYYEQYVERDADSRAIHPIFNNRRSLEERVFSFIDDYGVEYIIVSENYLPAVAEKVSAHPDRFSEVYASDTLMVYSVTSKP